MTSWFLKRELLHEEEAPAEFESRKLAPFAHNSVLLRRIIIVRNFNQIQIRVPEIHRYHLAERTSSF